MEKFKKFLREKVLSQYEIIRLLNSGHPNAEEALKERLKDQGAQSTRRKVGSGEKDRVAGERNQSRSD
ncbi:hypothetical protein [Fervidobacterium thailandense]|uniref:Uncharacterized protein n=1 Tax=Fervidobacterium thailandense TaxID=1008305 RepID=A0A1E3G4V2_9BACT|nr:hypothetical protein [Fervidobacterium thailandense]ODN31321.1 hypothetical protein A4H02_00700 [Fervidobacterium thailandense]